jgi:hypothetical protein
MGGALSPRFATDLLTDWLVERNPNATAIKGHHQTESNGSQALASTGRNKKEGGFHGQRDMTNDNDRCRVNRYHATTDAWQSVADCFEP